MVNTMPVELLDEIFQHLTQSDLFQCQKVCRSWYLPAQLLVLQQVSFINNSKVDSFLNAIGNNHSYIRAIKKLELGDQYSKDSVDAVHAERLLSCLQNIQDLTITGNATFNNLVKDTESRESITRLCLKLQAVKCIAWASDSRTYIGHLVNGLKGSLTSLDLMENDSIELVSGFPHLQMLYFSESRIFVNFEAWLPLFEQQFTLKSMHGVLTSNDRDNITDRYVQLKSAQEKELLFKKLYDVKSLAVEDKIFCPNSIQFMSRYFMGVRHLRYTALFVQNWSDMQIRSFCGDLLDFASVLQGGYNIKVYNLGESIFSQMLPAVVQSVFHRLPSNFRYVEKQLQINLYHNASIGNTPLFSHVNLTIKSAKTYNSHTRRLVDIRIGNNNAVLDQIKEAVSKSCNTDTFIFSAQICAPPNYLITFQQMMDNLPTLRKVVLYIFGSCKPPEEPIRQYNLVKQLELNVGVEPPRSKVLKDPDFTYPDTFAKCISMFPETKRLKLYYFSGFWKEEANQFEIPLQIMNLDSLYLDVTPVLRQKYDNKVALEDSCFVLCVKTANQRYMYQVSCDYLRVTKIDKDMQACTQVIINVASLKNITLYLYKDRFSENHETSYIQSCIENVMEAKLSLF